MMQYIPKSVLVAEIERLVNNQDSALDYEAALEDVLNIIDSLQEEPVSEDLEEAAKVYEQTRNDLDVVSDNQIVERAFKAGAEWQKEHLWKPADGDELPEIDREVVAFQEIFPTDVDVQSILKIVIAHRPNPEGYDGKSFTTGEVEHYTPKTYDKGGWNIPDVKYWLDVDLPEQED